MTDAHLSALAAVISAVAAGVQAFLAVVMVKGLGHARRQADASQASLDLDRDTAKRQLRAYMEAHYSAMKIEYGHPIRIRVRYKNMGQTPARKVRSSLYWRICSPADGAKFRADPPQENAPTGDTGPGAQTVSQELIPWEQWSKWEQFLRDGTMVVMVAGRIDYEDVFGEKHITEFRRVRLKLDDVKHLRNTPGGSVAT